MNHALRALADEQHHAGHLFDTAAARADLSEMDRQLTRLRALAHQIADQTERATGQR